MNKKYCSIISSILSFLIVIGITALVDLLTTGYITSGFIKYVTMVIVIIAAVELRKMIEKILSTKDK